MTNRDTHKQIKQVDAANRFSLVWLWLDWPRAFTGRIEITKALFNGR